MAYYRIEPFGEERADLRNAMLATILANAHAAKGRKYTIDDFMPKFRRQVKQTASQMQAILKGVLRGRIRKK